MPMDASAADLLDGLLDASLVPEPAELLRLRLLAEEISRRHPTASMDGLAGLDVGVDTQVYPHQVHAAHFAVTNPALKGVGLFDEVGLGKTVEAAMVIRELAYRGKQNILVIAPRSLLQQWREELLDRFGLSFRIAPPPAAGAPKRDTTAPYAGFLVATYQFVNTNLARFSRVQWDAVCVDEAHILKNPQGALHRAVQRLPRSFTILLTATPIQNSLVELHALASFLDPQALGTPFSFRAQFCADDKGLRVRSLPELKGRLSRFAVRTLRSDVPEIRFTRRIPRLFNFELPPQEQQLYDQVSAYLSRPNWAFGGTGASRNLIVMQFRKLLASSSFALGSALRKLLIRLETMAAGGSSPELTELDFQDESAAEAADPPAWEPVGSPLSDIHREVAEVRGYVALCDSMTENAKALRLVSVMPDLLQAGERVLIFTQYRATQAYLARKLEEGGHRVIRFHGGLRAHPNPERDECEQAKRAFREHADVMVATDAGAEGLNLQFCHVVVNYDLPWNPMKIEQRIGRAHRIGQEHDVVMANLVATSNAVDARLVELLTEKIHLFGCVLGDSDEILGAVENGVDFEQQVFRILQTCRTPAQVNQAFDALQEEMEQVIAQRRARGRSLLEGFDDRIRDHLRSADEAARESLDVRARSLRALLVGSTTFYGTMVQERDGVYRFGPPIEYRMGHGQPLDEEYTGAFHRDGTAHAAYFNRHHPLIAAALRHHLQHGSAAALVLRYTGRHTIHGLDALIGSKGWWLTWRVSLSGMEVEDHLLSLALVWSDGEWAEHALLSETIGRLDLDPGRWDGRFPPPPADMVADWVRAQIARMEEDISERNAGYYLERRKVLDTFYGVSGEGEAMAELHHRREELRRLVAEKDASVEGASTARERLALTREKDGLEDDLFRLENRVQEERHRNLLAKRAELRKLDEQQFLRSSVHLVAAAQWEMS